MKSGLAALCLCSALTQESFAAITLVDDGSPRATIVVAKDALSASPDPTSGAIPNAQPAADKIAAAARDLQAYIEKISGARLPIVSDETRPRGAVILVGRSALTRPLDGRIPSGLTPRRREEGFVAILDGDQLLLAGNDEGPYHGSEYAVADFLERLGVRWFMPGDYGEVVPKRATIAIDVLDISRSPDFPLRNWWGPMAPELAAEEYRWKVRNRMNPVANFLEIPGDSSTRGYLKENPVFSGRKQDGSPDPSMPNLSDPGAVSLFAGLIKDRLRKDPNQTSVAFAPDDGMPRDWTPETVLKNLGFPDVGGRAGMESRASISEEWVAFVDQVARDVHKEFPGVLIGSNGYANRNTPPLGLELDPDLYIMFAAIWSDTLHAYDDPKSWQTTRQGQMIRRWAELCENVYLYEYTYHMLVSAGTPVPLARKHARNLPLLKKWGVIGFFDEGRRVLMESGVGPSYLHARLMWDAGLDVKVLMDDFYARWYGAAQAPARAFWDRLEAAIEGTRMLGHSDRILPYVYTPELLAALGADVAQARRLAASETLSLAHVRADEAILDHLKGYLEMTKAEWVGDFAGAAKQADRMLARRKELASLSRWYTQADDASPSSGFFYWGIVARKKYYQRLASETSGKQGDLVTLLPETAKFLMDPRDEGRFARWFAPDWDDGRWETIFTTAPFYIQATGGRDESGYPYMGAIWYRFQVDVPAFQKGRRLMLYAPSVETEAWVWVNGRYIGHRPYRNAYERPNELDLDVTAALEPGKRNVIAVRVNTGLGAAAQAGGFYSRLLIYAPKRSIGWPSRP
ncbi:MAG: DUF4838 domain-containing protein [Elusimicrobiota bacterium]